MTLSLILLLLLIMWRKLLKWKGEGKMAYNRE